MDVGEVIRVLTECAEFVGVFGSDRADELLPQIEAARKYLERGRGVGALWNTTFVVPPPQGGEFRMPNIGDGRHTEE